MKGMKEL